VVVDDIEQQLLHKVIARLPERGQIGLGSEEAIQTCEVPAQ
jgi:hypothetical protein